jgi:hypothetical protein
MFVAVAIASRGALKQGVQVVLLVRLLAGSG